MPPRYSRDFLKTFSVMRAGLVSAWPNAHNERLEENIMNTSNTDKAGLLHEVYDLGNGDSVVGGTRHVNMAFCGAAVIAHDVKTQVVPRAAPVPDLEQHIPYCSIIANAVGLDLRTAALKGGVVAHRKNDESSRLGAQKELSESGRNFLVGQDEAKNCRHTERCRTRARGEHMLAACLRRRTKSKDHAGLPRSARDQLPWEKDLSR